MGTTPPSQARLTAALRGHQSAPEAELRQRASQLEQTLERLAEAVYHAQTYKDAPDEVKQALEAAQELLGL